ncbi:MAG: hypothetical protein JXA93_06180 [Anaerolineae bacterium]|nr:hypothetical protein [Anaerolineae bacterium]
MDIGGRYRKASTITAANLKAVARSTSIRDLSSLALPEVDAVADLVAQMVPAGNVPGVILNGLARLTGRQAPLRTVRRDVNLLFKGVEQTLDRVLYTAVFAGPAAVIWGYQHLLRLAGKNPEDSFPEGTWQFYADYALREDTARHANETHGFDTILSEHRLQLDQVDRMTAWVMAAVFCMHQYNDLLENEWRERVYIRLLQDVTAGRPESMSAARLYRQWEMQRPYGRGLDAEASQDYPTYRRACFDRFLGGRLAGLETSLRREWQQRVEAAERRDLPAYQDQMSILAYLRPDTYGETRIPIPLAEACVAVIYQGRYYLIPACAPGGEGPADVQVIRRKIAAMLSHPPSAPPLNLAPLASIRRSDAAHLRAAVDATVRADLEALQLAPVVLNFDQRPRALPLPELRQAERGLGDHALTIFDTGETFVFDQSHIFIDGTWGTALAEIVTNEALSWAAYLHTLPPPSVAPHPPHALTCRLDIASRDTARQAARVMPEVSAETRQVNLQAIQFLRRLFKLRNDLISLTVNDLLVLYRAIHAATYQPDPELVSALRVLQGNAETRQAALAALDSTGTCRTNPAIMILVDATLRSPRDRVYPMTFQVPLAELDLLGLHRQVKEALEGYRNGVGDPSTLYAEFDRLQRIYLATIAGFGQVMSRAKEIAIAGESGSVGTIKLLAHLPTPLQRMLDRLPGRIEVLNDIIKGREILSNVGAVVPSSTITRFATAKDDNEKKTLAWGIVTDAEGVMCISLRDFRPHVALLMACSQRPMAEWMARDYLQSYARGLNAFVRDLHQITRASRETHGA